MNEKELAVLWQIAQFARTEKVLRKMSHEDFARWVSTQLAESLQFYTAPCGACYLYPMTKQVYDDWHSKNGTAKQSKKKA